MILLPKNSKNLNIFGKKSNKKGIFTLFRVDFRKSYFFLLFSESHPILGVNPILRSNPDFVLKIPDTTQILSWKIVKKRYFISIFSQKIFKKDKKHRGVCVCVWWAGLLRPWQTIGTAGSFYPIVPANESADNSDDIFFRPARDSNHRP
jgi:hypothetical protein